MTIFPILQMFLQFYLVVLTWQDQIPVAQVFQEMINARQVPQCPALDTGQH